MASNKSYMLNDEFPKRIKNATSTSDGLMTAEDKSRIDELFEFGLLSPVSPDKDGIMLKEDKVKLDGIEEGANYYIHPDDEDSRHVTDEQIHYWNAKASTSVATKNLNGLMSSSDKNKLDSIEENANNYIHPESHLADIINQDTNHRFVTDEQIEYWNSKANPYEGSTEDLDGLMSAEDKAKLDSIEENANNYTHPNTHPADMIIVDAMHRFVTDQQINIWNAKADQYKICTQTSDGLMSFTDKKKLDSIQEGATSYTHPDIHPATMISQDATHRFVTDEQIEYWNSKNEQSYGLATSTTPGLMSAVDKAKLDALNAVNGSVDLTGILDRLEAVENKLKTAVFYTE